MGQQADEAGIAMNEPQPCPFCRCKDVPVRRFGGIRHAAFCVECCAEGPIAETETAAIRLWNAAERRKAQP